MKRDIRDVLDPNTLFKELERSGMLSTDFQLNVGILTEYEVPIIDNEDREPFENLFWSKIKEFFRNNIKVQDLKEYKKAETILRKCFKCKKKLYLEEYLLANIDFSKCKNEKEVLEKIKALLKIWNSPDIELYCCFCFSKEIIQCPKCEYQGNEITKLDEITISEEFTDGETSGTITKYKCPECNTIFSLYDLTIGLEQELYTNLDYQDVVGYNWEKTEKDKSK